MMGEDDFKVSQKENSDEVIVDNDKKTDDVESWWWQCYLWLFEGRDCKKE